jgi:histidyl-tRNA synthetase
MRDFLPVDKARRERVLGIIRDIYRNHGFDEIETPVMEDSSRLHAGLGGDNEKLAFGVLKRGLTTDDLATAVAEAADPMDLADLGLRFDLTVPLARFYATHHAELPSVFRAIQIAPVWRAERPQKGRYRQFVQCDIDIIGEPGILAEVELISATTATLSALGVDGCSIRINDRRLLGSTLEVLGFPASTHAAVLITLDKLDKLGIDGVIAELRDRAYPAEPVNAMSAFLKRPRAASAAEPDASATATAVVTSAATSANAIATAVATNSSALFADTAPTNALPSDTSLFSEATIRAALPDGIGAIALPGGGTADDAIADLAALAEALGDVGRSALRFDPFLVRGMGYYTGTIFEIAHPQFGYSLGGGGRYDGMIGRFLGTEVPAVGFSIGFERLVDLVELTDSDSADSAVLLYDPDVTAATLNVLKSQLIAGGTRVRLERRAKNTRLQLDSLAAAGFARFATVFADTPTTAGAASELAFKPLG